MPGPYTGKPTTVRGLIINSERNVSLNSFSIRPSGEEYARIRVEACGLCTWEQRVYRGVKQTYPFWGGHEVCGTVDSIGGSNSNNLKEGERVALALMRRCGDCYYCQRGLDNHCVYVRPEAVGDIPQGPRGLSDLMIVPAYQVFPLSLHVSAADGALVEPTACVLRSIDKGRVSSGNTAVVIGSGTMGLIHTSLLKRAGCKVALCGDDSDFGRASAAGADVVLSLNSNNLEEEILAITEGHGADAVFCTRGGVVGIEFAVKIVGRGGRVVLYQSIRGLDVSSLKANDLHYREIEIVGTISQTISDFQRAAELVSSHAGLLDFLATEVVDAERGNFAFEQAMNPRINRVLVSFS
ncbi:MAG: alcohol dehydrogenase catalytic domain-containing protein [Pyrinomonadaceae bacterium]